ARSRAEIRRCRAAATPDRFGFHLAQAVGVALQWSWLKVLFIVPLRHDQPVRSHDRVPMAGEEEYAPPQRHPRPKGRYDTLSLFSKLHSPEKLNDFRPFGSVLRPLNERGQERRACPLVVGCSAETGSDAGKVFLRASSSASSWRLRLSLSPSS